ncbi:hypothetical protein IX27_18080 [Streptomyces sp. JS01]|uniref:hypothetical protein n=1 Tax=unclassified Streptomyces TaxID=2593676 RepID=UPI000501F38C|nr:MULTISPECIES: hypothetical protein [unclassified Streptomyces]KFK87805.1 hypothetical protein IX27_18080 [Streptomyces sp. JS01]MBD3549832.1 hypothetical protein [Streptomyces sp. JV180]
MTTRPLLCTKCGEPVGVTEEVVCRIVWDEAVIDTDGTVRPAEQHMEFWKGDPHRTLAVCDNPTCRHRWTLRRTFEPEAPTTPAPAAG